MSDSSYLREVLDHGFVRMVDYMGGDLAISRAARQSYDAPPREEDGKLIDYLLRNKHTSPFEAVAITFEVHAPIFVFRQWHRHRTWSYNELSARYTPLPEEYYIPKVGHLGVQSKSSKQARDLSEPEDPQWAAATRELMAGTNERAFEAYHTMLEAGVPRELARSVLPLATYSNMFATVNLLNLFRFCSLRQHEHAQYEIRVYADAMLDLAEPVAPGAVAAFREHGL